MKYRKKLFGGGPAKVEANSIQELDKNMSGNVMGIPFDANEVNKRFEAKPKKTPQIKRGSFQDRFKPKNSKEDLV